MTAPLDGITVIEIDNWMAAPSAGAILADLGATVVKVEPLEGDPMRGLGRRPKVDNEAMQGYDFQFDVSNRGKQSVAVDLGSDGGRNAVHRLCVTADVFLNNLLPRRQERFGLEPDRLLGINSRLIHATLTGYGTEGPEAWRPGYDVTAFFGRSGILDGMRDGADGVVPMPRNAQGDHTTGLALVTAILAALRMVERTGEGQVLETSLFETAIWTQASDFGIAAVDTARLRTRGRFDQVIPTANCFRCGDDRWLVLNMPQPSGWDRLCAALGLNDLHDDPRLQDVRGRYRNMAEIITAFDEAFATRTLEEWGPIFDEHDIVWGPVLELHEVATDPQALALDMFPTIHHEDIGEYPTVRIPMRFRSGDVGPRGPAPELGAQTRAQLLRLGYTSAEVESLIQSGAVRALD